jgi:tetratricopeptide (TPR) repeat protein
MRFTWMTGLAVLLAASATTHARAAWVEAKSEHFIIFADLDPAELKAYGERLERFDQAVRTVRRMADPPLTDAARLTIYALKSESAIGKLFGDAGVAGFYTARVSGAAAFVPRRAGSTHTKLDLDAETIFFHEYAHHLQLQDSNLALPGWVREGFAEFFSTARIEKDGSVLIGSPPLHRAWGLNLSDGLPIEQVLGETYGNLTDLGQDQFYGRSWLLVHYLTFERSRRGQLEKYLGAIQNGATATDAAKAAFGDFRTLHQELSRYLRGSLNGVRVDAGTAASGQLNIRKLSPGEAALMDVKVRSKRGVTSKMAPLVAQDARKAAAPYPQDPFVQSTLAEAEYDAQQYSAAEAAADRALAVDPNNVHALIYKGRAQMAMAAANPASADWKTIRSWFARANKLDTENAEPLALYYLSYVQAGLTPTKNATAGLLYAVTLVPQDESARLLAVHQLLAEGRLAEAKSFFTPLAFDPHASDQWRLTAANVLKAIAAGDAKGAQSALEEPDKPVAKR